MPTANRRAFIPRAVELFLAQDYPHKQLVIVEDGETDLSFPDLRQHKHYFDHGRHVAVRGQTLCAWDTRTVSDGSIRYLSLGPTRASIGEKRNICCSIAAGDLIAHWDDDDWYAPNRLSTQVAALQGKARLSGLDRCVFSTTDRAWLFKSVRYPWLAGGSLVYERALWREQPFAHISNGEDVAFVDAAKRRRVPIAALSDPALYVVMLHGANTTRRRPDSQWSGFPIETVRSWMSNPQTTERAA